MFSRLWWLLAAAVAAGQEMPTFGTTVVSSTGFEGKIYLLDPYTDRLPSFRRMKPTGTIYTTSLRITPQSFLKGFPGITDRFEWFAIDYRARFWVENPGDYQFRLGSDDGSKLYINGKLIIDNDGQHPANGVDGRAHLSRGVFEIRVSYYQGPREMVALILAVMSPSDKEWMIFDTNQFLPPSDPAHLPPGTISKIKRGRNY